MEGLDTHLVRSPLDREDVLPQCVLVVDSSLGFEKIQRKRRERIKLIIEWRLCEGIYKFRNHSGVFQACGCLLAGAST